MSYDKQFCLKNKNGFYFKAKAYPIITTKGLKNLENYSKNCSEKDKTAINEFIELIQKLPKFEIQQYWKTSDGVPKDREWSYVELPCFCIVRTFGTGRNSIITEKTFQEIDHNTDNWGLEVQPILKLLSPISRICKKLKITFYDSEIKHAVKFKNQLENDEFEVVFPDIESSLYKSSAYVVFLSKKKFYCGANGAPAPLSAAKMFSSFAAAQKYIDKRYDLNEDNTEIAEVDIKLSSIKTKINPDSKELQEALAMSKKDMIDNALKEADLERLKKRVEEMEGGNQPTTVKRKVM